MQFLAILSSIICLLIYSKVFAHITVCNHTGVPVSVHIVGGKSKLDRSEKNSSFIDFDLDIKACHEISSDKLLTSTSVLFPDSIMANEFIEIKLRFSVFNPIEYSCLFYNLPEDPMTQYIDDLKQSYTIALSENHFYQFFANFYYQCFTWKQDNLKPAPLKKSSAWH